MTSQTPTQRPSASPGGETGADASSRPRRFALPYSVRAKTTAAVAILGLWEAFIWLFAPEYVARPSGIAMVIPSVVITDTAFHTALLGTMWPLIQGMVAAIVLGVVVGLAMGQIRVVEHGLKLYTFGLFALPMVAVVPLVTMWFGYSDGARLAVIIFAGFFPMALNVYDGTRAVPAEYLEVARSFRAPRLSVWVGVALPAALPYLLAGFRLAMGRVLVGAVVVEYMISIDGLGRYIQRNARSFDHNEAFVAVIVLAVIGVASVVGVRRLTRRYCPWYKPNATE